MSLLTKIIQDKNKGKKNIALLLDPEKLDSNNFESYCKSISKTPVSILLIGGSYVESNSIDFWVKLLKLYLKLPIYIFPGHPSQISSFADGILFLSLLSGRNPDYLIDYHVKAIPILEKTNLEIISTSYLLIGEENQSSIAKISKTKPMDSKNIINIIHTALAGKYLGHEIIYLEAGSGAKVPVSLEIIQKISENIKNPIFVGGGIKDINHIQEVFKAGADVVVIGNSFENNINFFNS
jgi:phosphoglycerol geranylgeranyltransferase